MAILKPTSKRQLAVLYQVDPEATSRDLRNEAEGGVHAL
jgi:hypothetical protein